MEVIAAFSSVLTSSVELPMGDGESMESRRNSGSSLFCLVGIYIAIAMVSSILFYSRGLFFFLFCRKCEEYKGCHIYEDGH